MTGQGVARSHAMGAPGLAVKGATRSVLGSRRVEGAHERQGRARARREKAAQKKTTEWAQ